MRMGEQPRSYEFTEFSRIIIPLYPKITSNEKRTPVQKASFDNNHI